MFFYILVDPSRDGVYKVGITKNPNQRLRSYRTAAPECYFHRVYSIPDRSHEKKIFYELSGAFKMNREVVYGPLSIIQNIIEGYLDDNEINHR